MLGIVPQISVCGGFVEWTIGAKDTRKSMPFFPILLPDDARSLFLLANRFDIENAA